MLNASDFQYIYSNGTLPEGKKLLTSEEIRMNTEEEDSNVSREWIRIEIKIYSLAKSLLANKNPKNFPPEFNLWIEYPENYSKLSRDFGFKLQSIGKSRDDHTCSVSFQDIS